MTDSDNILIERIKNGDISSFEEIVRRYEKKIYNIALRICGNPDDAYDMSQESFLRIYKSLGFFRGDASLGTWIYRLVANVCIDFMRREKKRAHISLSDRDHEDSPKSDFEIPDLRFSPESEILKKDLSRELSALLSQLTPEYRSALVMHAVGGLSYAEISDALDIEEGTVKSRIFRGREQLRKALLKSGNFNFPNTSNLKERE